MTIKLKIPKSRQNWAKHVINGKQCSDAIDSQYDELYQYNAILCLI